MLRAVRRRPNARLFLVALVFQLNAGFLGAHALATPGVLIAESNAGFVAATPVGLVLGAGCRTRVRRAARSPGSGPRDALASAACRDAVAAARRLGGADGPHWVQLCPVPAGLEPERAAWSMRRDGFLAVIRRSAPR
jgi:hypothetical protein